MERRLSFTKNEIS